MQRITNSMIERQIDMLNRITSNSLLTWDRIGGKLEANIGNYHLSGAYGGVSLHQITCAGGGIHDIFSCGHVPKRELFNRIDAYIKGVSIN